MATTASRTSIPVESSESGKPVPEHMQNGLALDESFDPQKHLNFKRPSKIHSMKDLGLPEGLGISPVAVSEPFPLFSEDAIHRMRAEILSEEVMSNCQFKSDLAQCQLRGFAARFVLKCLN